MSWVFGLLCNSLDIYTSGSKSLNSLGPQENTVEKSNNISKQYLCSLVDLGGQGKGKVDLKQLDRHTLR